MLMCKSNDSYRVKLGSWQIWQKNDGQEKSTSARQTAQNKKMYSPQSVKFGLDHPKVIHNQKCGKMEKNELYTELFTLST